jgi:hypothetical protein
MHCVLAMLQLVVMAFANQTCWLDAVNCIMGI